MNEEELDRQAFLEPDDKSRPWQFLEHLRIGRVIQLPSVTVPIVQLEPLYVWGTQKIVYPVPEQLHGQDLVLKMYRDPPTEDQPLTHAVEDFTITVHPTAILIPEPSIGTVELSNSKAKQYYRARGFLSSAVPDTYFFLASDSNGQLRNWEVQQRIHGDVMKEVGWRLPYLSNGKKSFKQLTTGVLAMLNKTGFFPDLQGDILATLNIVVTNNGDCFLVDTDCQFQIDPGIVRQIIARQELIYDGTNLHRSVNNWMQTSDTPQAGRCRELLPAALNSIREANGLFKK